MSINLYKGDCLDIMTQFERGSIDMVLTDLPYGTTSAKWDTPISLAELWNLLERVSKENAAMAFTAQTPFDKVLGVSNLKNLRYEWIWKKNIATGFMNAKKMPMKIHENVLVFYKRLPVYNPQFTEGIPYITKRNDRPADTGEVYGEVGIKTRTDTINEGKRYPVSFIECDREIGLHPTQKPVALMEYFIRTYTNKGDTVLDCCMGSGSTGVACVNTERNFVGIEMDEKYFATAHERISLADIEMSRG